VGGQLYSLVELHLHSPSEHTILGERVPLELHIVHALPSSPESRVIVSILYNYSSDGSHNPLLTGWWWELFRNHNVTGVGVNALIEQGGPSFWSYQGSVTTPPCAEGVRWFVALAPVGINRVQELSFDYALNGLDNYRNTQPLNGRALEDWVL